MRRRVAVWLCLLASSVACAGPHSSGALWVQQYGDEEKAYFATTDAERQAQTLAFELGRADAGLTAESQRIQAELQTCPGPSQDLLASPGDVRRDAIRVQSRGDAERLTRVARLALMDWYARRASATGDARFCDTARAIDSTGSSAGSMLDGQPMATVTRDPRHAGETPTTDAPLVSVSRYALGSLDTVTAAAPLPQYLAWVYGGTLLADAQAVDAETAAARVDAQAPAYPDWEPDALYAALRGSRP